MKNQIELRHIRYFQMLSEELHYRKAAEKLFISQSALSKQIIQLEELLETQLFIRDKKKVSLSDAGKFFKTSSVLLLNDCNQMLDQVRKIGSGNTGEIRIGFVGSAMQNVIPELLIKARDIYPNILFQLDEMANGDQISKLEKGELDIGFVRVNTLPPALIMKPIFKDTFSLVLPQSFNGNTLSEISNSQLNDAHFILFDASYSPFYFDTVMSICQSMKFTPNVTHKSVHASTIFRLIENNMGISIVPTSLLLGFDLNIKHIPLTRIKQRAILSIAWHKRNQNPSLKKILNLEISTD